MPEETFDVVIVGGGGMGSAAAYFLKSLSDGQLSVAVVEPDATYAKAATALAAGGIRQQFSTPENIRMSQFGYQFLEGIGATLAVHDERPEVGLTPRPYLRLSAEQEELAAQCALQRKLGAGSRLLELGEIGDLYPWMSLEGVSAALLGGAGEGLFDPYGMLQAFRRKATSIGVSYLRAAVVGLELEAGDSRIKKVRLSDGRTIGCGRVINAAGPRAASVAAFAQLDLPVVAMKAHSFAFRAERPVADCPIVIDQAQGLQFKPEGSLFVCSAPRAERNTKAADGDFEVEPDLFEAEVWPRLAARVPQFESLRLVRGWVGHIEFNLLDGNPIIGPHPEVRNFYFLNGFSGHGAQHVPAAGRAIAELIVAGHFQSLDLSRFGFERVVRAEPIPELA